MKDIRYTLNGAVGPIVLVGVGSFMLTAVVVPSPARIALWKDYPASLAGVPFPEPPRTITESDLGTIAEHPLFNSDRKKDPPPEAQTALPGLDSYRLAGVIVTGTINIAIIERKQAKTTLMVKVGDLLDGRTIINISADGVTLGHDGRTDILCVPKVFGARLATQAPDANNQKQSTNTGGDRDHQ